MWGLKDLTSLSQLILTCAQAIAHWDHLYSALLTMTDTLSPLVATEQDPPS